MELNKLTHAELVELLDKVPNMERGEASMIVLECIKRLMTNIQPERSKREDSSFKCALCNLPFDPSDWQNDVCDKCLYKR